jgi:hypothetical protein
VNSRRAVFAALGLGAILAGATASFWAFPKRPATSDVPHQPDLSASLLGEGHLSASKDPEAFLDRLRQSALL